jgi:hypothetical protein
VTRRADPLSSPSLSIQVVEGRLPEERAAEILSFLAAEGALEGDAARRRLSEVLCLALEGDRIVGLGSAYPAEVPEVANRPFWAYESLGVSSGERWSAMFNAAFEALSERFRRTGTGPVGICVMVADPAEMERRPEAVWPDTELMLAAYTDSDNQVRIRYFWGAAIAPGDLDSPSLDQTRLQEYPLGDRYRIEPLTETSIVSADDVLRLWAREGAVPEAEARQRVREVRLVATERDEGVVGVSSAYLRRNAQLRMELWHYRTFVAREHRQSSLAAQLIFGNRDLMQERFVRGEDTRAGGMVFELENEGMKRHFNKALWLPADFTFIGENDRGDHVRVHYFPGARAPLPSTAS